MEAREIYRIARCVGHRASTERAQPGIWHWKPAGRGIACDVSGCIKKADAWGDCGKKLAPEVRARMSAARKKAWADKPLAERAIWASKVGRKKKRAA